MPAPHDAAVSVAEPEPLISREEVVATLFNVADIAAQARIIRQLLEENGKRKRISKERIEQIHREAENHPNVRRLRELAERAQAQLDARKRARSSDDA